jgi:twitching motility protein PilT
MNETDPNKTYLTSLMKGLFKYSASDLHLKVGRPPLYRVNGRIVPAKTDPLTLENLEDILSALLNAKQKEDLQNNFQVDLSFFVNELGRFRANVFYQKGQISCAIRAIPIDVPRIDSLSLPSVLKDLVQRPRGILIITGPTGSGKSTTLAALVRFVNENFRHHIISIEDPIEFIHEDIKSTVSQREIGIDTHSYSDAIIACLRQDPDLIVLGELRDSTAVQNALTAAETGHLVLTTLHTKGAVGSIERILDTCPIDSREQVRVQLASSLVGICSQTLIQTNSGGCIPVCEILVNSPTIQNLLIKNQLEKIPEVLENSNDYYKMQSLNQHLVELVRGGKVKKEEALRVSQKPKDLELILAGFSKESFAA